MNIKTKNFDPEKFKKVEQEKEDAIDDIFEESSSS